jgi:hypothetical protein
MDKSPHSSFKEMNCRDPNSHRRIIHFLDAIFHHHRNELKTIHGLAQKIKLGICRIDPFIQKTTQTVCPSCKDVCCISRHGYYNFEDLIYLYALEESPAHHKFGLDDSDPCQYLTTNGCSMDRSIRPSGCNWYFCDSLLDRMEIQADYQEFDDILQDIATRWMEMIEEFTIISCIRPS